MQKTHRISIVLASLLLTFLTAGAQRISQFSHEPEKFLQELISMFNESKKGQGKEFVEKEFGPLWTGNAYSVTQQQMIYETSDQLLKAGAKTYPDFENFLQLLIAFPTSGKTELDMLKWNEVLLKSMSEKKLKKYYSDFLRTSYLLFRDLTFYETDGVQWKSSSRGFIFEADTAIRVVFPALDLKCYSKGDSSVIYQTSGIFYPGLDRWIGSSGKVTWKRAGFDPEKTFAQISDYNIRVRGSTYDMDSVIFYNEFFDTPLAGKLTDKILAGKTEESATYPRFD
ncbi:MAG: hypothetical protein JNM00_12750, partial [Flavobacteriales bacterium]|nr:hypothetical protein [Flavobacteriales bacterium]